MSQDAPIILTHPIDPMVDVVFKALLGSPEHEGLLVHFLNSVLRPKMPIISATVEPPQNSRRTEEEKAVVLDIKARDGAGRLYDVEVQSRAHAALAERAVYYWSSLYTGQIIRGQDYEHLAAAAAIWILGEPLWEQGAAHHHFELVDRKNQLVLTDHCAIHFLQPSRWAHGGTAAMNDEDAWLYFFRDAASWTRLPPELEKLDSMRQAMSVLQQFSEAESSYFEYLRRLDALRVEATWKGAIARAEARADEVQRRLDEEKQRADEEKQRADEALRRADEEKQRADEAERRLAELEARLRGSA